MLHYSLPCQREIRTKRTSGSKKQNSRFLMMHLERSTVELQQRFGAAANNLPDFASIFCDALPDVTQVGNATDSVEKLL